LQIEHVRPLIQILWATRGGNTGGQKNSLTGHNSTLAVPTTCTNESLNGTEASYKKKINVEKCGLVHRRSRAGSGPSPVSPARSRFLGLSKHTGETTGSSILQIQDLLNFLFRNTRLTDLQRGTTLTSAIA